MLPRRVFLGETVDFLATLSDSIQLLFLGSLFLLGGFAIRRIRSVMLQYRSPFSPRPQQPPEQAYTTNS